MVECIYGDKSYEILRKRDINKLKELQTVSILLTHNYNASCVV